MQYCTDFFIASDLLWRKAPKGQHKIVVKQDHRLFLISSAHNDTGHHGFYATNALITERYWWPHMSRLSRYRVVHPNLPSLSTSKSATNFYSTCRCSARSLIRKSLYGHHAPYSFSRLQIHRPSSLFSHPLARMGNAS